MLSGEPSSQESSQKVVKIRQVSQHIGSGRSNLINVPGFSSGHEYLVSEGKGGVDGGESRRGSESVGGQMKDRDT